MRKPYFASTSPESVGIDSSGITKFLDAAERSGLELHRMMILRHGKCLAHVTWAPYGDEDYHPLFSFSKSLTATAIGFACQEGLLRLDEKLVDLFPEDCPEVISDNLAECTIHHLLCMSCGHEFEPRCDSPDWRKVFLAHPFPYKPGTFFRYNTAGSNMLAAIVKKKTGLQVLEYLRPRLLDPLGMGEVLCISLPDDMKTQHGGGGMRMQLEDMAKFTQFMLQDGCWEGKVLLKDWYFKKAGVKQMETAGDSAGHVYEWANGYGYQCWMCNPEHSFRADGAFGQFGIVYPTMDLCVILSSATEQTQTIFDHINAYLLPAVADHSEEETEVDGNLFEEERSLLPLSGCRNPVWEQVLAHSVYVPFKAGTSLCGIQELVGGAGRFEIKEGEITKLRFLFDENTVCICCDEDGKEEVLRAALDKRFIETYIDGVRYTATARWRALRKLEVEARRMDALSGVRLIFNFDGKKLRIDADETLMTDGGLGMVPKRLVEFTQVENLEQLTIEVTGNNPAPVK